MGGLLNFADAPHGGDHKLLPEWNSQPPIDARTIIDHSVVGSSLGAFLYFRDKTGIESHFNVRGRRSLSLDGFIWQHMSIDRRADANWHASAHAISIETEDDGDPDDQRWTPAQLDSLLWLHERLAALKNIPRRRAPETGGGLGYHSMHGAPSEWTNVSGKTCPGKPVRVAQFEQVLLPAFLHPEEVLDMYDADAEARLFKRIEEAERRAARYVDHGDAAVTGSSNHHEVIRKELAAFRQAVGVRLDALEERLTPVPLEPIEGHAIGGTPLKLSPHEIAHVAAQAGWTGEDLRVAVAVCLAESGGDFGVMGRSDTGASIGNWDHGGWQISGRWHGDKLTDHPDWRTPATNAALAFRIWTDAGRQWTPWAVFNSGAYEKYLPDADIAIAAPFPVTS